MGFFGWFLSRASARTRDRGMLTGRTRLENFSSLSFLYTVHGLARLNISLALALYIQKASFYI
jgi:hypothetical protein